MAISEATKAMAVERVHVKAERITVLPPIAGGLRAALDPREALNRLDDLDLHRAEFAVYPANFWPHKNHERLLAATGHIVREEPEFLLVLCGALDERREKLRGLIESLGLERNVRLLPYLEDADTTALLEGAEFLVFPSLFEGFGLPVLEAMALGTPVGVLGSSRAARGRAGRRASSSTPTTKPGSPRRCSGSGARKRRASGSSRRAPRGRPHTRRSTWPAGTTSCWARPGGLELLDIGVSPE